MSLLELSDVSLRYPGTSCDVLADVELTVEAGELLCVLGPNGAGKSSLLRVAGGLVPAQGKVTFEGRPLRELASRERARAIATVPQGLAPPLDTRVRDFVLAGRYAHVPRFAAERGSDREAVREALERVDSTGWEERLVTELSGGQFQRVLLARALAQEARLLLVDEPTTALDPAHQVIVFELLRRLVDDGASAVVATHDLSLASAFSDRLLLLEGGTVQALGSPREVLVEEHLVATYGRSLFLGSAPVPGRAEERPFVVSWPAAEEPPAGAPDASDRT